MATTLSNAKLETNNTALSTGAQSATDLVVAAADETTVHGLIVANTTAGTLTVDIAIDDGTLFHIALGVSISGNNSLILEKPITLNNTERLKVKSNSAGLGDLVAFASVLLKS